MAYVPIGTPRFRIASQGAGEVLIIPAQRNVFVLAFLSVWLVMWTIGGLTAMGQLLAKFHLFVAAWLVAWAIGWTMVVAIISWMLMGQERVQVIGGDLEVGYSVWGVLRRKLFRGADVRGLKATPSERYWQDRQFPPMPVLGQSRGSVQFSYGARTQSFGFGLDSTEAAEIVAWLQKKLPGAA